MFSQTKADVAVNFFEKILRHSTDEYYGKPFLLAPWQEEAITTIFGNIQDDGTRIIETAYLEISKKSGKSEFCAGLILLVLTLEATKGCQIYGAASATRQALNVYRAAAKMVEQSPLLKKRLRLLRSTNRILKYSDPDSFYAAIAADGDLGDGVNPAFVVADELHRWRTRKQIENWDVLSNGGITRKQTLTVAITTAGVIDESPLAWRMHEKTRRIQAGIVSDPKFYGRIYSADKEDDPAAEATWIKACPSLKQNGGFLDIEKYRERYVSHLAEGDLSSFNRYFLNIWDQRENFAIDINQWDASSGAWEAAGLLPDSTLVIDGEAVARSVRPLPVDLMARFLDRECWTGVDLSMTTDLSAVVFVFPCDDKDETYDVLPFFWLPEANIRKLEKKLGVPLQRWAAEGYIELSAGSVIDTRDIKARLEWGSRMFSQQEICWDPWNSRQLSTQMIDEGHTCLEVRQGFATLSEPTKKIRELIANGRLHHGGNPVLRWMAGVVATADDKHDNIMFAKPDRAKSTARIDGMSAIANAMSRIITAESKTQQYTGVRSVG